MFGNRIGWGISAAMWAGAIAFLFLLYHQGTTMRPPGWVGQNASKWTFQLPVDPSTVATWMDQPGDATPLYAQAIAYYLEPDHRNAFYVYTQGSKPMAKSPERAVVEKGIAMLIAAGRMREGSIFANQPEKMITYDSDYPELEVIKTYYAAAMKTAAYDQQEKHADKAHEIYQALFSLGSRLYRERLAFEEWYVARELMSVTHPDFLPKDSKDPTLADRCKRFDEQIGTFYQKFVEPVQITLKVARPSVPDCVALAQHGGDLMWRVEATLALGRCKYAAEFGPDINGAIATINELQSDPNPRVRLAAKLAKDLKIEDWRKLR